MLHPFFETCATLIKGADMATGLPVALLMGGLAGSWLHCTSMCGINTISSTSCAKSSLCGSQNCSKKHILKNMAAPYYHGGRMLSYALLTLLTYGLFHIGFAWSGYRQLISVFMLFLAGSLFLAASVPLFHRVWPWTVNIQFPMPSSVRRWLFSAAHRVKHPFARGFFVGFMPCGLLFSALLAAGAAPSISIALLSITAFVIGTIPALVAVQMAGHSLHKFYPVQWRKIQSGLLVMNGLFFISLGIYLAVTGF